jgi:hypothetical protein
MCRSTPASAIQVRAVCRRPWRTSIPMCGPLDNWHRYDTIFRLRTGEALGRNRMEVAVHFRPVPHLPRGMHGDPQPNVLRFGLEPESIIVELTGVGPRANTLIPLTLTAVAVRTSCEQCSARRLVNRQWRRCTGPPAHNAHIKDGCQWRQHENCVIADYDYGDMAPSGRSSSRLASSW